MQHSLTLIKIRSIEKCERERGSCEWGKSVNSLCWCTCLFVFLFFFIFLHSIDVSHFIWYLSTFNRLEVNASFNYKLECNCWCTRYIHAQNNQINMHFVVVAECLCIGECITKLKIDVIANKQHKNVNVYLVSFVASENGR